MKYCFLGILFVLLSCNGQKKTVAESSMGSQSEKSDNLELLLQDEHGDFVQAETTIIKDQKRLRSFYAKINKTRKPGLPIPVLDFSKEMVIVQCSGELNRPGIPTLTFDKETDSEIILSSKLVQDKNSPSIEVVTYPFCLYKMPLTEKEIVVRFPKNQQ